MGLHFFREYAARQSFIKSVINTRTTTSEQHQGSFGGASSAKSTEGAVLPFPGQTRCAGLCPGRERGTELHPICGRQDENKGYLTPRSGAKLTEGAPFLFRDKPAPLGSGFVVGDAARFGAMIMPFSRMVEGPLFLLLEVGPIILYYATISQSESYVI